MVENIDHSSTSTHTHTQISSQIPCQMQFCQHLLYKDGPTETCGVKNIKSPRILPAGKQSHQTCLLIWNKTIGSESTHKQHERQRCTTTRAAGNLASAPVMVPKGKKAMSRFHASISKDPIRLWFESAVRLAAKEFSINYARRLRVPHGGTAKIPSDDVALVASI